MKLTTKSEYSILALIFIARHQQDGYVKVEQICSFYDMPKKYLEQLMVILKQNRYLNAKRGAGGGYRLIKNPKEISLADIFRLMDGALAPSMSVSTYFYSHTPLEKERKVLMILKKIRNYIVDITEKTSLADLL